MRSSEQAKNGAAASRVTGAMRETAEAMQITAQAMQRSIEAARKLRQSKTHAEAQVALKEMEAAHIEERDALRAQGAVIRRLARAVEEHNEPDALPSPIAHEEEEDVESEHESVHCR